VKQKVQTEELLNWKQELRKRIVYFQHYWTAWVAMMITVHKAVSVVRYWNVCWS